RDSLDRCRSTWPLQPPCSRAVACAIETSEDRSPVSLKKKPPIGFWKAVRKVGPSTPTGVLQTWSMPISALQQLTGSTRDTILKEVQKGAPGWFPWSDVQIDLDKTTVLFAIPEAAHSHREKITYVRNFSIHG